MQLYTKLQRLYHTVRPLRFEQIAYRIYYKLFPLRHISSDSGPCSSVDWVWHGPEVVAPSFLGGNEVCFLNLSGQVNSAQDWNNPAFEKLWLYNLHYFDDLNSQNSLQRTPTQIALVERWISENPAVSGNGWEPYPLSLRLVNWIKWYNRATLSKPEIIGSIDLQAKALSKQLEYHILGNHLFANGKALVFSGCFLAGATADKYLDLGLRILDREIPEQFLKDGGHFELSPMYHCILLWDLLELLHLAQLSGNRKLNTRVEYWSEIARNGLTWLKTMLHPDGEVSFFNDSAIGIASTPQQIFAYAQSIGLFVTESAIVRLQTLAQSGYSKITMPNHSLIFDHAQVGPDYLPGHAHADTLSFEWSVGSQRVFVNSGTSIYGVSAERLRQRQTAAHNTVVVNGVDSSEVWSGFRVARRAKATLEKTGVAENIVTLTASHDGYHRLADKVRHRRSVMMMLNEFKVTDTLIGGYHSAVAHFHLHPDVAAVQSDEFNITLTFPKGKILNFCSTFACKIVQTSWHPGFGQTLPSLKLEVEFKGPELNTFVTMVKV
jgi:uncharacterized heparinase superfamily protein